MKSHQRIFVPALLALTLGTFGIAELTQAQPEANTAAKPGRRGRAAKAKGAPLITPVMLEKILRAPLTPDQKAAVAEAAQAYQASIAKAVGLTTQELNAKAKEFRKAQRNKKAE